MAFMGVFYVIAMEEVSWFQRQIGFETPDQFYENVQGEFNLHNFFTVGFEIAYYFGSFVFFVVLPFIREIFHREIEQTAWLRIFMPTSLVTLLGGAMSCGYNFEMWNILPVQFAFISTVLVLIYFGIVSSSQESRWLFWITAALMIVSQWIFLNSKESYERIWEVTEYKEMFITIGFFAYAAQVRLALRRECCGSMATCEAGASS